MTQVNDGYPQLAAPKALAMMRLILLLVVALIFSGLFLGFRVAELFLPAIALSPLSESTWEAYCSFAKKDPMGFMGHAALVVIWIFAALAFSTLVFDGKTP